MTQHLEEREREWLWDTEVLPGSWWRQYANKSILWLLISVKLAKLKITLWFKPILAMYSVSWDWKHLTLAIFWFYYLLVKLCYYILGFFGLMNMVTYESLQSSFLFGTVTDNFWDDYYFISLDPWVIMISRMVSYSMNKI